MFWGSFNTDASSFNHTGGNTHPLKGVGVQSFGPAISLFCSPLPPSCN